MKTINKDIIIGIIELANISIKENTISKIGYEFLKNCKSKSNNGALEFMTELIQNCKEDQINQVEWLFLECMPILNKKNMETLLQKRIMMHARNANVNKIHHLLTVVSEKWKKLGYISENFTFKQ